MMDQIHIKFYIEMICKLINVSLLLIKVKKIISNYYTLF